MNKFTNLPIKEGEAQEIKKIEPEKVQKRVKKRSNGHWRLKAVALLIILSLLITGTVKTIQGVGEWFDNNKVVSHSILEVKIQPPFTIEPRVVSPLSEPKEADSSPSASLIETTSSDQMADLIVTYIHSQESSNGTSLQGLHVTCKGKGMTNEYGYRAGEGFCFKTASEAIETVKDWVHRSLAVRGVLETLCRYNTGYSVPNCTYAESFKHLLADEGVNL